MATPAFPAAGVCYTLPVRRIPLGSWLLAAVSGVLQVLIFPTPSLYFLSWIAVAPLLVAILGPRPSAAPGENAAPSLLRGFLLGFVCGLIFCAGNCYWIYYSMTVYGRLSPAAGAGVLVLLCVASAATDRGVFGLCLAWVARRGGQRRALVLAPFLWVAVELGRERLVGFPWDLLGYSQVDNIPLARIASLTGVWGIAFELVLVNAAFAAAWYLPPPRRGRMVAASLLAALVLQAGVLVKAPALPATHTARLVQPDIPILDPVQWTEQRFGGTLTQMAALSLPAHGMAHPDLIVWPESPAPFWDNDGRFRGLTGQVAMQAQAWMVVGELGLGPDPAGGNLPLMFNSAALVAPRGEWAGRYDKIHLVPWGEYVPAKDLFSFASKLTKESGDFTPGRRRLLLEAGGQRLGTFICYESIFPDEVRQFAAQGAQVFVNISNDGWFGPGSAPGQHLNMARMRAIENGRWLLRDTNSGITASIDPLGRVVDRAPRGVAAWLDAPYALVPETTFYTRHGDWFPWLCAIISLGALLFSFPLPRRAPRN
ncbi:MAG TPA: apolipoprotein N-acyltransferase [Terriglobales bacterium]|nr:apolipoprotein N-acyltransferase [Terriglobales bacterium]